MLPHGSHLDSKTAEELLAVLKRDGTTEIDLAASKHFYDVPLGFDWRAVTEAYNACFDRHQNDLTAILGTPIFVGNWESPDLEKWTRLLPPFADALRLVVWKRGDRHIYLRQGWEDKEIPILIALGLEGCKMTGIAYPGQFD